MANQLVSHSTPECVQIEFPNITHVHTKGNGRPKCFKQNSTQNINLFKDMVKINNMLDFESQYLSEFKISIYNSNNINLLYPEKTENVIMTEST